MKRITILTGGAICCIVVLIAAATHFHSRSTQARDAKMRLERQDVDLADHLRALRERRQKADESTRAVRGELESLQNKVAAAGKVTAEQSARRSNSIAAIIRNDPQAEALYLRAGHAELAVRYGPLFRTLGLSDQAAEQFLANCLKRDENKIDLDAVLDTDGPDGAAAVAKLRAEAQSVYARAQRELLGDAGYETLQEYERTASERTTVSAIAGAAAVEHVPFTPEQADALVGAMAGSTTSTQVNGRVVQQVNWNQVLSRAHGILTPQQFEVFTSMDPGPSHAGLAQYRLYSQVNIANAADAGTKPGE